MRSRITIDVDASNQPVIKIEYSHSEDVRDKLVKRFLEGFGADSVFAHFYYVDGPSGMNSTAQVSPMSPTESAPLYKVYFQELVKEEVKENE